MRAPPLERVLEVEEYLLGLGALLIALGIDRLDAPPESGNVNLEDLDAGSEPGEPSIKIVARRRP